MVGVAVQGHEQTSSSVRASIFAVGSEHVVSRQGTTDTLERKLAHWLDGHGIFDRHEDTRANQNLTGLGFVAKPRCHIGHRPDYHAAIGETIIKYSGTLERYAGDGVMVVFNDPVPVEKPALQAVLMACAMPMPKPISCPNRRHLSVSAPITSRISSGFATLGTIGFEGRFDYAATIHISSPPWNLVVIGRSSPFRCSRTMS